MANMKVVVLVNEMIQMERTCGCLEEATSTAAGVLLGANIVLQDQYLKVNDRYVLVAVVPEGFTVVKDAAR